MTDESKPIKHEYRILAQNTLAGIEALARKRQEEGFELVKQEKDLTIVEVLEEIKKGKMVTISAKRPLPPELQNK